MELKDSIVTFKNHLTDLSVDELMDERNQLNDEISKMILDNDLILKVAIIEEYIKHRLEESQATHGSSI